MTITQKLFCIIDKKTKSEIIESVANHYGISNEEAYAEIIDDSAEHILDYLTGSIKIATSFLLQKYNLAA